MNSNKKIKVLVVEDDINFGNTLKEFLNTEFTVHLLHSGATILHEIKEFNPTIILMDICLNEKLDGIDLVKQIRLISSVPVFFTTTVDDTAMINKSYELKNTDFLNKPLNLNVLKNKIIVACNDFVQPETIIAIGQCHYNFEDWTLSCNGLTYKLNHTDAEVLKILLNYPDRFVSRKELIDTVWDVNDYHLKEGSLSNALSRIRKYFSNDKTIKIETRNQKGVRLQTINQ